MKTFLKFLRVKSVVNKILFDFPLKSGLLDFIFLLLMAINGYLDVKLNGRLKNEIIKVIFQIESLINP